MYPNILLIQNGSDHQNSERTEDVVFAALGVWSVFLSSSFNPLSLSLTSSLSSPFLVILSLLSSHLPPYLPRLPPPCVCADKDSCIKLQLRLLNTNPTPALSENTEGISLRLFWGVSLWGSTEQDRLLFHYHCSTAKRPMWRATLTSLWWRATSFSAYICVSCCSAGTSHDSTEGRKSIWFQQAKCSSPLVFTTQT